MHALGSVNNQHATYEIREQFSFSECGYADIVCGMFECFTSIGN
jgi:hypothetical protein